LFVRPLAINNPPRLRRFFVASCLNTLTVKSAVLGVGGGLIASPQFCFSKEEVIGSGKTTHIDSIFDYSFAFKIY